MTEDTVEGLRRVHKISLDMVAELSPEAQSVITMATEMLERLDSRPLTKLALALWCQKWVLEVLEKP